MMRGISKKKKWAASKNAFPIYKGKPSVSWINVDGLHDTELIEKVGKNFNLHPLVLEDTDVDHYFSVLENIGGEVESLGKNWYRAPHRRRFRKSTISSGN
jgi:magnesium transporter